MYSDPSISELIASVQNFINDTASPNLEGHAKFQARIASNVLAIVLRELEQRPRAEAAEIKRLQELLNNDSATDTAALNRELSTRIASSDMHLDTPGLLNHLKKTAIAQLHIDQPKYSGLKTAEEGPK